MHPILLEIVGYTESERTALLGLVGSLTPAQLEARPAAEAWSAAEILEHLAIIERSVVQNIGAAIASARTRGMSGEMGDTPLAERFAAFRDPRVREKIEAPERVRPTATQSVPTSLESLAQSRAALRHALEDSAGLPLDDITLPHPLFGELALTQWVLFIGAHERRHASQIERGLASAAPAG